MMNIRHLSIDKLKAICRSKRIVPTVCVVLIFCMIAGVSIAWITSIGGSVTNDFDPALVTIGVTESPFDHVTKRQVRIENTSTIHTYIRVALVPEWIDENGNVVAQVASLADCDITWGAGVSLLNSEAPTITPGAGTSEGIEESTWFQGSDGYYYCIKPIPPRSEAPKNYTPILIEDCIVNESEYGNQYDFELRVIASAVQAIPKEAVLDAWGSAVDVDGDGKLIPTTPTPEPTSAPTPEPTLTPAPTPAPTCQTPKPEQSPEQTQGGN